MRTTGYALTVALLALVGLVSGFTGLAMAADAADASSGFSWGAVIAAAAPIVTGLLASLYVSWRAKVIADGVSDWKDEVVKDVDAFMADVRGKKGE